MRVLWPSSDAPSSSQYRNLALLESAVNRPFQTFSGEELHPSIFHKAAALFHSLVCNHCFQDGNKRTAVIATTLFLAANRYALAMAGDKFRALAVTIASHNERGLTQDQALEHLVKTFRQQTLLIDVIGAASAAEAKEIYTLFSEIGEAVRSSRLNAEQPPL